MRLLGFAWLVLAAAGCRAEPATNASAPPIPARHAESGLDLVGLEIEADGRTHRFVVEVARTGEQQARGLMFRRSLGPNEGMIFPVPAPRPAVR